MNPSTTDLLTPSPYDQPPASSASDNGGHRALVAVGGGMQTAEVMELLQAMREEQLSSLKSIADGVQQLQTQVLLLSEVTNASEQKTSLCLERLAGVERRVGSIPVPIKPPAGYSSQQASRGWTSSGTPAKVNADSAPAMSPSPPARVVPPSKPSWMDRTAEQKESSRPHFMRASSSTSQARAFSPASSPAPPAPVHAPAPPLGTAVSGGGPADAAALSAEEAAKEAKRRAFEEDRAKIQARIAATKASAAAASGSGKSKSSGNGVPPSPSLSPSPSPSPSQRGQAPPPAPVSSAASRLGTADSGFGAAGAGTAAFGVRPASAASASAPVSAPAGANGPAFSGGPGGAFSSSPYFLSGASVVGGADPEEDDEASKLAKEISAREEAERQERERQERQRQELERQERQRQELERQERQRQEAAARLEREREEARRRREEEEARKARELAEARLREEARRKAEARRQAKTRDIMSSLFDKEEGDDGSSLFRGLGAAVPAGSGVFSEAEGPISSRAAGVKSSAGASSSTPMSGTGGSLFSGIPEVGHGKGNELEPGRVEGTGSSGSLFGNVEERAPPKKSLFSSEIRSGSGGSLFDRTPAPLAPATFSGRSLLDVSGAVAGKAGSGAEGKKAGGADDFVGQKKGVFGDDRPSAVTAIGSSSAGKGLFGDTDHLASADDFLSSPPSYGSRPSVPATASASASVRKVDPSKKFPEPTSEAAAYVEDVDDIFAPVAGSSATGHGSAIGQDALGGMGLSTKQPAGGAERGSLFDRPEFSIDSGDEDGLNVFGGSGPSGDMDREVVGDVSSSFLTALGDAQLSLEDDGGSTNAEGLGIPGRDQNMVDVSL